MAGSFFYSLAFVISKELSLFWLHMLLSKLPIGCTYKRRRARNLGG